METVDGRILHRKRHQQRMTATARPLFQSHDVIEGTLPPHTSRSCAGRHLTKLAVRDSTLDSDDVVRRLTRTPNPEFTRSLPLPVSDKISNDCFRQGIVEVLQLKHLDEFVRCTGCQWDASSRCMLGETCKKHLCQTSPTTRKKRYKQRIFTIRKLFSLSSTSFGHKDQEEEREVPHQKDK